MSQDAAARREGARETQSVQSLERGLAVLQVFSRDNPAPTLSEVARLAGTTRTTVHPTALRAIIAGVRTDGHAMVDQELELGLRSVAAPIRDAEGRTVAALNLSAAVSRVPLERLQDEFLPALLRTAGAISTALG